MKKHLFEIIFSIKRKCMSTEERIRNEYGLSHAEFNGLITLQPDEEVLGNAFAERLCLSPSRGSRVLTKMLTKDFVNTQFKPNDRRSVSISLSKNGEEMKKKIENKLDECEKRILTAFSKKQVIELKKYLILLDQTL